MCHSLRMLCLQFAGLLPGSDTHLLRRAARIYSTSRSICIYCRVVRLKSSHQGQPLPLALIQSPSLTSKFPHWQALPGTA